jgi:hypothetical protein
MFNKTRTFIHKLRPNITKRFLSKNENNTQNFFEKNRLMIENFFEENKPMIEDIFVLSGIFGGYIIGTIHYHKISGGQKLSINEYIGYTSFVSLYSVIGGFVSYCASSVVCLFPIFSVIYFPLTFATYCLSHKYLKLTN